MNPQEPILAIETSQREGGVALAAGGEVFEEALGGPRDHERGLMAAIDRVVRAAGLEPGDLRGVGVSIGPGGFTGLRIGVTAAKVLGDVLGARIAAVPSALVAAESCEQSGPILVALAGKANSAWITRCERGAGGRWHIAGQPGLREAGDIDLSDVSLFLADRYLPEPIRGLCEETDTGVVEPVFRPTACLAVSRAKLKAGETTDPLELSPLYPREPEAVAVWKRRLKAR